MRQRQSRTDNAAQQPINRRPSSSAVMRVLSIMRRYAIVGLAANTLAYVIYLVIT